MRPFIAGIAFAVLSTGAFGQTPSTKDPMAIHTPTGANTTTEVDVSDTDLLKLIKSLIQTATTKFTAATPKSTKPTISFATSMGAISIDASEVKDLLAKIHRVHLVAYEYPDATSVRPMADIALHEQQFKKLGLRRMFYMPGKTSISVMRSTGTGGMGVVFCEDRKVTVVRTDGPLNYDLLNKWLTQIGQKKG